MATPLLKRSSTQIFLLIVSTVGTVFVVFGFIHQVRQTHTTAIDREWGAALQTSQKLRPGVGRAEDLLARLKRIDPGYAPDEMKRAMTDYITALEADIDALKTGRDIAPYDKVLAQAQQELVAAAKKDKR